MKRNIKKILFSTESIVVLIIINILLITAAFKPDFLQSLETVSYDFSMTKSRHISSTRDKISIITIDRESVANIGQWPWDRSYIADMLEILTNARAKVIGLQFPLIGDKNNPNLNKFNQLKDYLQDKSRNAKSKQYLKLNRLLRKAEQELNTDGQLARKIDNAPNLILTMKSIDPDSYTDLKKSPAIPAFMNKSKIRRKLSKDQKKGLIKVPAIIFPYKSFAKNAHAIGHNNFIIDHDGEIRSQPLILRYKNSYFPSFSLLLAARSRGIPPSSIRITDSGIKLGIRNIKTDKQKIFYPYIFPQNKDQTTFNNYSFYKVLNGEVPPGSFRNKTVIIGLDDTNITNQYHSASDEISYPTISANIITSLIDQNYFSRPASAEAIEIFILVSVLLYLFFIVPNSTASSTALITLFIAALLIVINQYLLIVEHIWLKTVITTFILLSGHILYSTSQHLSSTKRKFIAQSAESTRMLVTVLQSQGQIDMAMDKLRSIPKTDASVLGLAYSIAQDYESKRQYGKAVSVYDYILNHDKNFRDTADRKNRVQHIDSVVLAKTSGSIIAAGIDTMPKLGHYEIEKEIGRGAMGVVYLGRDSKINRTVAIKTLALSEEFKGQDLKNVTKRFFKEAEVAGKLNHPNIVTVYDAGQEHDLTYMAMEYLKGYDLTHYINGKTKPKVDWVLDIIWHIAGALDYAHAAGIIHRDVKPANIMYSPDDGTIKITDFGIARLADLGTTKTGTTLGTPAYMSPEQLSGEKIKGSSDFFSLGVTMYELLTGKLPFQGDSLPAMIYQITTKRHKPITQLRKRLPPCVKTIVDKLLQKEIKKRYPDGASIQEAIERCMKR